MARTIFKCPYCDNRYIANDKKDYPKAKSALYTHMETTHKDKLGDLSPAQAYFNFKYKKTHGSCVMCHKETKWNESVERYERFCSEKCKEAYREMFKQRMMKKYGKEHLLDDPSQQKKMLENRSISGKYKWSDGKSETKYTGSYEKEFLEFLDVVMNMSPTDVFSPAPQIFHYEYEGKDHFYIPDFYIATLNLIVEIKDGGSNPNNHQKIQQVDKAKEKLKDTVMKKQKEHNYIKVIDKDYSIFLNYLLELKYKEN